MALVYLDDIRLNAEVSGPVGGPAVVLLHALGTELAIWDEVVPLLPAGCRILRFDQRGHGLSDVPEPPYAMGALIRDAERMMGHFGMRDAVVVGLSLGGLVAQGLAVKRLDLVRGMVLSNTAAKIGSAEMWDARVASVQADGLTDYATGAMQRMFGRKWQDVPGMPRVRAMLEAMDPRGWVGCASAIAGTDFYTPTAGLTLPTLAIAGALDGTTPPDLVRETADLILGSRLHLIRGAGHLPMVEKPEEYAAAVGEFLRAIGQV
ncbi:3-oxoadipate enol-lactonase [Cypionkella sp. TWP1-2-1b2]|uniref:3-oxoadipate enol-lactonase n=1 Tax=Cypionkella sp. TWP1-2-1b2 TaxID=2804675 RepID=UPI003CE70A8F